MIYQTTDNQGNTIEVHELEGNFVRQSALAEGDKLYVPKQPKWLADKTDTNDNARVRVLLVEILEGNNYQVKPVYYNQLCRMDRKTKALAISDSVNNAVKKGGNKAFDKLFGGKILKVNKVEDTFDYVYANDNSGNRLVDENGNYRMEQTAKAYGFESSAAGNIKDADMQAIVDQYIRDNFTVVQQDAE